MKFNKREFKSTTYLVVFDGTVCITHISFSQLMHTDHQVTETMHSSKFACIKKFNVQIEHKKYS